MSNIFKETDTAWSPVPRHLCQSGLVSALSPRALRLYIFLLDKASRLDNPVLFLTVKDEQESADILPRDVVKTRIELAGHRLIKATRKKRGCRYELLQPNTGAPIPQKITEELSEYQIVTVLGHLNLHQDEDYISRTGVKTLQYICPFHAPRGSRSKRKHLSVNATRGMWQCHLRECAHNGKRRLSHKLNPDGSIFDSETQEAPLHRDVLNGRASALRDVYAGGGNFPDLVAALLALHGEHTSREIASLRVRAFLKNGVPILHKK